MRSRSSCPSTLSTPTVWEASAYLVSDRPPSRSLNRHGLGLVRISWLGEDSLLFRTQSGLAPSSNSDKGQVFTPESTKVTLRQACNVVGLDPTDARLMRLGTNAVFRLVDPVVVRIARLDNLDEMTRTVQVARWLESDSYPAVRALAFDQPVVIDGTAATFWEALSDGETYASVPEVADLLSRLHALTPPAELILALNHLTVSRDVLL